MACRYGALAALDKYPGRDLSQAGVRRNTAAQCAQLCAEEASCRAMSFAATESGAGLCFLKDSASQATPNPAMMSGCQSRAEVRRWLATGRWFMPAALGRWRSR